MIAVRPKEQKINVKKEENSEYICPIEECKLIPEIQNVHCELGLIVLKCSNGHTKEIDVKDYFKILDKKKGINPEGDDIENKENPSDENVLESNNILTKKINLISDIISTHKQILDTQEEYPENYFHNKNIINLSEFIEKENSAKVSKSNNENETYKIDDIIKEIEDKRKKEDKIIEDLKERYGVCLDKEKHINNELSLILKGPKVENEYKKLGNKGFKLLSQIIFKNLIELNLANNKITEISPLNDMFLPHLEIIDLSENQIKDISPVAELESEYLSEIYLQNNKIEDLGPFLKSDFKYLELLRVDGNNTAIENRNFPQLRIKYGCKIMSEPKKWDDFSKKYNFNLKPQDYPNLEKLDLGSRRNGEILMDLCPLITSPNKIKFLILDDNKLEVVSLLTRMPLYNLIELDLSLNYITNIRFLNRMSKCKKLQRLYLHDNKINDISPLRKFDEGRENSFLSELKILTLKNNCLNLKDMVTLDILKMLIDKSELTFDYGNDENIRKKIRKISLV